MRASSLIIFVGMLGFTVSCAHKKPAIDEGQQAKVEQKIEKKDESKDKQLAYTCLVGKDQRLVTLDKKEKRCEVNYTKFGDAQQVAWAEATPSICDDAFSKIRTNIEGSGYACQDGTEFKKEEKKETRETAAATQTK